MTCSIFEKWPFTEPHVQKTYLKEKLFSVLSGLMTHYGDKRLTVEKKNMVVKS